MSIHTHTQQSRRNLARRAIVGPDLDLPFGNDSLSADSRGQRQSASDRRLRQVAT